MEVKREMIYEVKDAYYEPPFKYYRVVSIDEESDMVTCAPVVRDYAEESIVTLYNNVAMWVMDTFF